MAKLNLSNIFRSEASSLAEARARCRDIHGTDDIRAAGNEVEEAVRSFFRRMLPVKYYVGHGHIVDSSGNVSPQIDIIISDSQTIPSLMKTRDDTEYFPYEAVYAIGEVKSTYYGSRGYIESLSNTIRAIRETLSRDEIPNTAYGGVLTGETNVRDMILHRHNQILNYLFSFALFVDCGDFTSESVYMLYQSRTLNVLPNVSVMLNKGVLLRGRKEDGRFLFNRYPEHSEDKDEAWYLSPLPGDGSGSPEGNHLGFLYFCLLNHLNGSLLEPPRLSGYLSKMMQGRMSLLERIGSSPG